MPKALSRIVAVLLAGILTLEPVAAVFAQSERFPPAADCNSQPEFERQALIPDMVWARHSLLQVTPSPRLRVLAAAAAGLSAATVISIYPESVQTPAGHAVLGLVAAALWGCTSKALGVPLIPFALTVLVPD